jgi:hypothetical protein
MDSTQSSSSSLLKADSPDDPAIIDRIQHQHDNVLLPVKFSWLTIDEHRTYLQVLSKPMNTHSVKERRLVAAVEAERDRYNQIFRQRVDQCRELYQCYLRDVRSFVDGFWIENQRADVIKHYRQNWIRDAPEDLMGSIPQEMFNRVQALMQDSNGSPEKILVVEVDPTLAEALPSLVPLYPSRDPLKVELLSRKLKEIASCRPRRVPLLTDPAALQHAAVLAGEVDIIITASALDSLLSAAPSPIFNPWQVPFGFLEIALTSTTPAPEGEAPQSPQVSKKRVLVIDKPFLPVELTPRSKNETFYKRALKLMSYEDESDERRHKKCYSKVRIGEFVMLVRHRAAGIIPGSSEEGDTSPARTIAAIHASMSYLPDGSQEMMDPSDSARLWMKQRLCGADSEPQTCVLVATVDPFEQTITDINCMLLLQPSFVQSLMSLIISPLQTILSLMYLQMPSSTGSHFCKLFSLA